MRRDTAFKARRNQWNTPPLILSFDRSSPFLLAAGSSPLHRADGWRHCWLRPRPLKPALDDGGDARRTNAMAAAQDRQRPRRHRRQFLHRLPIVRLVSGSVPRAFACWSISVACRRKPVMAAVSRSKSVAEAAHPVRRVARLRASASAPICRMTRSTVGSVCGSVRRTTTASAGTASRSGDRSFLTALAHSGGRGLCVPWPRRPGGFGKCEMKSVDASKRPQ